MRFAVASLMRSPGFTLAVILTLALGIGATTAIFTVVDAVVLRPLDYPRPDQLMRITSELRRLGAADTGVAAPELFDYQSRTDLFAGVAGLLPVSANVTSGGTPERLEMMLVSVNYFGVLGVAPAHGRVFAPEDDTPGVANVAVVSDGFWRRRLGADPQAVGSVIVIDQDAVRVVGVMPPGFRHPGRTLQGEVDVWSPAGFRGTAPAPPSRGRRRLEGALARLRPGVTPEQARASLAEYGERATREFASEYPEANGWQPRLVPLQDALVRGVATPMFILLSAVGLLLLIACVNVAHLVLARSTSRRRELAIRQALGASGGRLTRQLLTESLVLASAGGVLAVLVASWALRGLLALAPGRLPGIDLVRLDGTAMVVIGAIVAAVTMIFGLIPALHARRVATFTALKDGGSGRSTGRDGGRARDVLVAAEVAMATVLLIGAGLLVRSVSGMLDVAVGFETEGLVTARVSLPRPNDAARAAYLEPGRRVAFYRETLRRVAGLPGVEQAAMSTQIPLGGYNPPLLVEIDGGASGDPGLRPVMHDFRVSPGYFDTMRVGILRGRAFTDADTAGAEPVVIVSDAAVRLFWAGENPIGRRVRLSSDTPWMTVVGVAGDLLNRRLTEPPQPLMYRPLDQSSDLNLALLIRTRGPVPGLDEQLAREVRAVDPNLPVHSVRSMTGLIETAVSQSRFLMRLLVAFAGLATALALLGIYGVMAYAVSQRTREVGIRMALGARPADVSRMILARGMRVTAVGVGVGLAAALALSELIRAQLFGIRPSDPLTLGAVLTVMTAVAAVAAYLPARAAARVDPQLALRNP